MTDGGLVLPNYGMDEAAIWSALKEIDPGLKLVPPGVDYAGRPAPERIGYRVVWKFSDDKPPEFLFFWGDEQTFEPWPLSSGLVERAKMADKNTRGRQLDELAREAIRKQDIEKRNADAVEGAIDTWVPKHGRPILPRSRSLQRSRDKRRSQGEKI